LLGNFALALDIQMSLDIDSSPFAEPAKGAPKYRPRGPCAPQNAATGQERARNGPFWQQASMAAETNSCDRFPHLNCPYDRTMLETAPAGTVGIAEGAPIPPGFEVRRRRGRYPTYRLVPIGENKPVDVKIQGG
jgi:hypothetical protein